MLLYLGIGSHGDRSVKLFGDHKSCYDGQWPLTGTYFKCCGSTNFQCLSLRSISVYTKHRVSKLCRLFAMDSSELEVINEIKNAEEELCKKANQKVSALARISSLMRFE